MSIGARLAEDLKTAMKAKDAERVACIRQVRAKLQEAVNAKGFEGEINDALHLQVLTTYVKSLRKAIEEMEAAGEKSRELREKYGREVSYLETYLPKMLGEDETRALVEQTIARLGVDDPKRSGQVIGAIMKEHKGQVDPGLVSRLVKEKLS